MEDPLPTARWAARILRPLTSIYNRLEKHQRTLTEISMKSKPREQSRNSIRAAPDIAESGFNYQDSDADDNNDPGWIPGKKPARRVKKYSARTGATKKNRRARLSVHNSEALPLPGAIQLSTPLLGKKRWKSPNTTRSNSCVQNLEYSEDRRNKRKSLTKHQDQKTYYARSGWHGLLNETGDPVFAEIVRNLDIVLEQLLSNCEIGRSDDSGRGARSLFSMVVRSLPKFIAIEQEEQNEKDPSSNENMCSHYFTELQLLYAPNCKGWKPLREAARAQGIHLVSQMIRHGWIPTSIKFAVVAICSRHPDACEPLLTTIFSTLTFLPHPLSLHFVAERNEDKPILFLRSYGLNGSSSASYVSNELAKLLMRGVIPAEWMATKLWNTWMTYAIISVSNEDENYVAAERLVKSVILAASDIAPLKPSKQALQTPEKKLRLQEPEPDRACPVPVSDALDNHVTSLLARLCDVHIHSSRVSAAYHDEGPTEAWHMIRYLSDCLALRPGFPQTSLNTHITLRRGCILIAMLLLECNDTILTGGHPIHFAPNLEEHAYLLASRPGLIKELALFVRQALRCLSSSDYRLMVSRLLHVVEYRGISKLLGRVAMDAAMNFAEETSEPDDHVWALEIQETVISFQKEQENSVLSPVNLEAKNRNLLYRWEESINEWIARTPKNANAASVDETPYSSDSDAPENALLQLDDGKVHQNQARTEKISTTLRSKTSSPYTTDSDSDSDSSAKQDFTPSRKGRSCPNGSCFLKRRSPERKRIPFSVVSELEDLSARQRQYLDETEESCSDSSTSEFQWRPSNPPRDTYECISSSFEICSDEGEQSPPPRRGKSQANQQASPSLTDRPPNVPNYGRGPLPTIPKRKLFDEHDDMPVKRPRDTPPPDEPISSSEDELSFF
ncbi:hypothetical protein N7495_007877 [Penicillium taxi]|uniref:uncharacterized protein n=1 Tax=Penicillium taxi TaxID=168475 RepID=UPI002545A085|nr:uncharacterized protein N7495_007877 [Penicillium taxi]KAJ5887836.1 hypothetical protein N7495_007877 [Penicillium taxi]